MQPMFGIFPAATPLGAPSSDLPANDTRSAADPTNGGAFRTALNAARQTSDGAGSTERTAGRPNDDAVDDATRADTEHATDAAPTSDLLAMLLPLLTPAPLTSTTPLPAATGVSATATLDPAAPVALTTGIAVVAAPSTGSDVATLLPAGATDNPMSVGAFTSQAAATATAPTLTASDGIALPAGLTPTPPSSGQAEPHVAAPPPSTPAALSTTTPQGDDASIDAQALAAASPGAATSEATAATSGTTTAQAATSAASAWTDLAADFGARIVAVNSPTTRSTGPASQTAPIEAALADDAGASPLGSTARAAGVESAAAVQLPGQAVAGAGAPAQASTGSFAETLAAGSDDVVAVQAAQPGAEAATELQTAALGVTSTSGVGQVQESGEVQASATAAPPVSTQIADAALLAARRIGQSVQMILQPEGLGTVSLRVSVERAGLGVHIAVDNPQAREMVQASWPQLQQALEQRGLTVQSLLLDLSSGRGDGEAFQTFQQFNGQQQFAGQQARGGPTSTDRPASLAATALDESFPMQPGAGITSRVDYRI